MHDARQEVDHGGDDKEINDGGDEGTEIDESGIVARNDAHTEALDLRATKSCDKRVDDIGGKRGDNGGKGSANDNRDGEVDDVATHEEGLEIVEVLLNCVHVLSLSDEVRPRQLSAKLRVNGKLRWRGGASRLVRRE